MQASARPTGCVCVRGGLPRRAGDGATTGSPRRRRYEQSLRLRPARCRRSTASQQLTCASTRTASTTRSPRAEQATSSRSARAASTTPRTARSSSTSTATRSHDDQVPGFGTSLEAGSIGEAFGDYLAVTVGDAVTGAPAAATAAVRGGLGRDDLHPPGRTACGAWTPTKHCLEDVVGEVHADGEIEPRLSARLGSVGGAAMADDPSATSPSAARRWPPPRCAPAWSTRSTCCSRRSSCARPPGRCPTTSASTCRCWTSAASPMAWCRCATPCGARPAPRPRTRAGSPRTGGGGPPRRGGSR